MPFTSWKQDEKTDKEKVIYYMTLGGFLIAVTNNYLNDSK